ncbi:potassium transporter TrkG [Nocardiopsis sp. DSM 44743]|uniref:Potassium transporter TrkG n=1 Tax=Nocardiopsis lambiniae TaxID=3075539 RepID=A0ABU2M7F4_9ACTN|nr:potassium transporter TrkG [Nocardiopsis sp. DSM 44743]MDT0328605.1 potassium transporter TrkG [Nocardiopsis sp. DSM 44743]
MRGNPPGTRGGGRPHGSGAWKRPPLVTVTAFGSLILVGTLLLSLPVADHGSATPFLTALFTATSAASVTGLVVVDTADHWSPFGEAVILALIQVGGFGIMAMATVLTLVVSRRMGLRMAVTTGSETKSVSLGEVRQLVLGVLWVTLVFEGALALLLTLRWWVAYDLSFVGALHTGVFHSISAFNNAGFSLYSDSLTGYATDPWITVPVALGVIAGGLGFPVWVELWRFSRRRGERRHWTLHAKLTLGTTAALLLIGFAAFLALEWTNPATMGPLSAPDKALTAFFQSVMPRTAGFNSLDFGAMRTQTLLVTDMLMFVGGGSAGTAGGIKVTTFAVLILVAYANVRGEPTVHAAGRRLTAGTASQATTVVMPALGLVLGATLVLMTVSPFTLDQILFETTSAFATVGLSTGITADLPPVGQGVLIFLMFVGRIGPITLASALALRRHGRLYELPEERPIVG